MRKKVTLIFALLLVITSMITSTTFARSWDGYYPCKDCEVETWHVETCTKSPRSSVFEYSHRLEGTADVYCAVFAKYYGTYLRCIVCGRNIGTILPDHVHAREHTHADCPDYGLHVVCPY